MPANDPRPLGAAQPIMDGIQQVGHAVLHPIDALRTMLGMDPRPEPVVQPAGPTMVDEANESFRHPAPGAPPMIRRKMPPK